MAIHNAEEEIVLDAPVFRNDSILVDFQTFDAGFRAAIRNDSLIGEFVIHYADNYRLPFVAVAGQSFRFADPSSVASSSNFTGKYDVQFFNDKNSVPAMGIITQDGSVVKGTFLTPTGDYRYLEGNVIGDTLWMSAFDGNHLFVFNAVKRGDTLRGTQWLGRARNRPWLGVRNENAQPPSSESLTLLKDGYDRLSFSFPDTDSTLVSLEDPRFKGKVVVIQILGSWCPNCLDETRFLVEWLKDNKEQGVEVIGLAYEQKADFDYASARVRRMIDKLGITYPVLIAGTSDTKKASETLPALNQVIGFPTTIFIDRSGKVAAIHTGFSGPGTGQYYELERKKFSEQVAALAGE
jgi:thiol-disulfide isomerase/thioredoxin